MGPVINSAESKVRVGYGKSFASFGEIIQGCGSDDQHFLVTLPIDMWSICNITCVERQGPTTINCSYEKSKHLAQILLKELGLTEGFELNISFSRNIPVGKGLSSSTADMLSTARALQELFGFILGKEYISKIFSEIEPHDALHYKSSVLYNHREGELLQDFEYIPRFNIIFVDNGGQVDTVEFNKHIIINAEYKQKYDALVADVKAAFAAKSDDSIAQVATESAQLLAAQTNDPFIQNALEQVQRFNALGMIVTHSGTCVGYLFPKTYSKEELEDKHDDIQRFFDKPTTTTTSLNLLA